VQAKGSPVDPCATYKGERLYVAVNAGFKRGAEVLTYPVDAEGRTAPLCSDTFGRSYILGLASTPGVKAWVSDAFEVNASLYLLGLTPRGEFDDVAVISGPDTLLAPHQQQGPGVDSKGDVWVGNGVGMAAYLTAYAPDANGNVAPIATIGYADGGNAQGFIDPTNVTFDPSGYLFVFDVGVIHVFAPPFSDSSVPVANWSLPNGFQWALSSDARGTIYATSYTTIYEFAGGFKSGGIASRIIQVPGSSGVAADASHLYVALPHSVAVLPLDATLFKPDRIFRLPKRTGALQIALGD
jgi:hypothetical protein